MLLLGLTSSLRPHPGRRDPLPGSIPDLSWLSFLPGNLPSHPQLGPLPWREGGGKGVPGRGSGATFLRPSLQSLHTLRVVPTLASNTLRLQVPQPRSIAARGTRLLSPSKPLDARTCPPGPVSCHPTGALLPRFYLVLQAPSRAAWAPGQPRRRRARPGCVSCSSPGAGTAVPWPCPGFGVLRRDVPPARCSLLSAGMLASSRRLGSGPGRWRVVIGLHHWQPFLYKLIKENTGKNQTSRDGVTSFVLCGRGKRGSGRDEDAAITAQSIAR